MSKVKELGFAFTSRVLEQSRNDLPSVRSLVGANEVETHSNLIVAYAWATASGIRQACPDYASSPVNDIMLGLLGQHVMEMRAWNWDRTARFFESRLAGYDDAIAQQEGPQAVLGVAKYFWVCCHNPGRDIQFNEIVPDPDVLEELFGDQVNQEALRQIRQAERERSLVRFTPHFGRDTEIAILILAMADATRSSLEGALGE